MKRHDIGRLVFESPALLGGAAGRMGLSCSSCHLNGRGNASFMVEGVSGMPGTADVTSSIFSKIRGDGTFNPVAIPDLAARNGAQMRDRTVAAFRSKVHGLVVEEFDGQEPPDQTFDDLVLYLDSLSTGQCDPDALEPVLLGFDQRDARAALKYAGDFAASGESGDAILMTRVARSVLERLHERFIAPDQSAVRQSLVDASTAIGVWAEELRAGRIAERPTATLEAALLQVEQQAMQSLYNPDVLRAALGRPE